MYKAQNISLLSCGSREINCAEPKPLHSDSKANKARGRGRTKQEKKNPLKHLHTFPVQHVGLWPIHIKLKEAIITPCDDCWKHDIITTINT